MKNGKRTVAMTIESPKAFRLFSSALLWSAGTSRPKLCQVHVAGDGARVSIASTDGHGLWFCESAPFSGIPTEPFQLGILTQDVRAILRFITYRREMKSGFPETVRIAHGADGWSISVGRLKCDLVEPEEEFPRYTNVIPKSREKHDFVGLNPALLARVAKSLPGRSKASGEMRVRAGGQLEPVRFDGWCGETQASVIVMPMRISSEMAT